MGEITGRVETASLEKRCITPRVSSILGFPEEKGMASVFIFGDVGSPEKVVSDCRNFSAPVTVLQLDAHPVF